LGKGTTETRGESLQRRTREFGGKSLKKRIEDSPCDCGAMSGSPWQLETRLHGGIVKGSKTAAGSGVIQKEEGLSWEMEVGKNTTKILRELMSPEP